MYKKKTGIIGIIITVVILIILVFISNINIENLSYIENAFSSIVMPIQNGLTYLKNKISGNNTFFADINKLKEENEELRNKNLELEKDLREFEIIKSENTTLKEYLNLTEQYSNYNTKAAYIINKDISNYSNIFVINIGEKDGIKPNMTVISEKGLVGYIISTTSNTAKVQTIIDTASTVSSTISSSRETLICKGTLDDTSSLKATNISTTATIIQGDKVETSGMGGIYPKGILIGTIKKVENTKNIVDRYAIIEPAVNFDKVETVLVIISDK
ncbi:MAG: rod shape-determining protein MreC [Clostridia bacterium]|jgi:rod shape-determining protein MreC|nr:rod shape-determining protein MreC [Clostridia bacterium]